MMEEIHIPDGIAVKLLLVGIVLASGAVGALGFAPATSQAVADGTADDSSPTLMFPINNVTVGMGSLQLSLDGTGNDSFHAAFPINNFTAAFQIDDVTVTEDSWDVKGTDQIRDTGIGSTVATEHAIASILPQDMDPY